MNLALVIPFHNEERCLPSLIRSLREQTVQNVPIVFIDNASTDRSAALARTCEEVKTGKWTCIEERKVGKFHAMQTAAEFCKERWGAKSLGFLDADSYPADHAWSRNSVEIVESAGERFGYTYSPFAYFGFDELPTFKAAYLAYERVLHFIVKNVGWLANGQGFVCSADTVMQYFQNAEITTEIDLRCSLLALLSGQQAFLNPTIFTSSGRRMVVNANNFSAWCFYERGFYSKKDINDRKKLNLNAPDGVEDLHPVMVRQFFKRRAMKITCRHLIPFAIFSGGSSCFGRIRSVLGVDVPEEMSAATRQFRENADWILTNRYETMIRAIEADRATIAVAKRIESLMCEQYDSSVSFTAT